MEPAFQLPGLHLYEYLLILDIPGELKDSIEQRRRELTDKYLIEQPPAGRPNVSLARFSSLKMNEERIIRRLQLIASEEKPFMVQLEDYAGYPMHAIFIHIANQQRVLQLIKNLKQARRLMKSGGEDPYFLQDPNIALAGRITKEKYTAAMKEYMHEKFRGRFIADSFLLLKRAKNEKRYQLVRKFDFQCVPESKLQGMLFQ